MTNQNSILNKSYNCTFFMAQT